MSPWLQNAVGWKWGAETSGQAMDSTAGKTYWFRSLDMNLSLLAWCSAMQ